MATELFKLVGTITIDVGKANETLDKFESLLTNVVAALNNLDTNTSEANTELVTIGNNIGDVATELSTLDARIADAAAEFLQLDTRINDATSEMTLLDDRIDNLVAEFRQLGGSADTAGDQIRGSNNKGFGAAAVWLGNILEDLTYKAFDMSWEFVKMGFQFNSSAESYKAAFKTMLGVNDAEATSLYEKMREFAVETPLALDAVAESAVRLFNAGYDADGVFSTLQVLGDIARGDNAKMQRLVKAWTDISNYGWMRAQERNQLVEADVAIYRMLADYYKLEGSEEEVINAITGMQENKEITKQDVWNAFMMATSEEGSYYNAMAIAMETWGGQVEKTGDQVEAAAGSLTVPFFDVIKSETLPEIQKTIDEFKTWADENYASLSEIATSLSGVAIGALDGIVSFFQFCIENKDVLGPALEIIGIDIAGSFLLNNKVALGITAIATAFGLLTTNWQTFEEEHPEMAAKFEELTGLDFSVAADSLTTLQTSLTNLVTWFGTNGDALNTLLVLLGGFAIYAGHPLAGTALIATGGHNWILEGQELHEEKGIKLRDNPEMYPEGSTVRNAIESENTDTLEGFDKFLYEISNGFGASTVELAHGMFPGLVVDPAEIDAIFGLTTTNNDESSTQEQGNDAPEQEQETDNGTHWYDSVLKFFGIPTGSAEGSSGGGGGNPYEQNPVLRRDFMEGVEFDSSGNNASLAAVIAAALQNAMATLRSEVSAGAKEGVSAGVGSITVTGNITTGAVRLDTGALVGSLTPRIDMQLGTQSTMTARG